MRSIDDCIPDLVSALTTHLEKLTHNDFGEKITPNDFFLLGQLSSSLFKTISNGSESDSEDEQEAPFSIKSACRNITRELTNHSGELTSSEKKHLLEMIEAAAKVMQFY
jgi:hypothetical protein